MAALRDWERRFPVASWKSGSLHVWPLLRIQLATRLLTAGGLQAGSRIPVSAAERVRRTIKLAGSIIAHGRAPHPRAQTRADVALLYRAGGRVRLGKSWYDQILDPLADIIASRGLESLSLEYCGYREVYRSPPHHPVELIRTEVNQARVKAALAGPRSEALEGYGEFLAHITRNHPHVKAPTTRWVHARASEVEHIAELFEAKFRRTRPTLALCLGYYSRVCMAFCLAASRFGIPSVDVQHGVTLHNAAYEGWIQFPRGGYELCPTRFWVWSERDTRPFADWPSQARRAHSPIVGGHPWMAFWQSDPPSMSSLLEKSRSIKGNPPNVLVSLSWSTGFSGLLQSILRDSPEEFTWWIRLHPTMDRERTQIRSWCKQHVKASFHVDTPTDLPLPVLLRDTDIHLTHSSTVVQEAAGLGIPSILIDRRSVDLYAEELKCGWAEFAEEPTAIYQAIGDHRIRRQALIQRGHPVTYPSWDDMGRALSELIEYSRDPQTIESKPRTSKHLAYSGS